MNQRPSAKPVAAVHIIAGLNPSHGGPSYSVPRLCAALAAAGCQTSLMSVTDPNGAPSYIFRDGYSDARFSWEASNLPILRSLRKSSALSAALRERSGNISLVHNHGVWLLPNMAAGWESSRARKPLVVSPRGMLSEAALAYSPMKKWFAWSLAQRSILRSAACIHATSEAEYNDIRARGLKNPVAIVPNGIDIPLSDSDSEKPNRCDRTILSLGRIHPKKGLADLLHAWALVEPSFPHWRLRIVGPDEGGYETHLRALASTLGLSRVSIEAALHGSEKLAAYRGADIFVLSSRNENFGLTVAESLAAGTAVISTKGAPWRGIEQVGCGWWIDHGVEPLTVALRTAMTLPRTVLQEMGARGTAWMRRDFSWERVAQDILAVYQWIITGNDPPATLRRK